MPTTAVTLLHGSCLDLLPTLESASVDSIVTDPPYELGFMGKQWDASGIAYNVTLWAECLRVLKPGGHLLAFGGTRTHHRMACAIEDAGFEIRDSIHWLYGSGFPKSLDVSKAIDKLDARDEQQARRFRFTAWVRSTGITARQIDEATGTMMGNHYTTHPTQPAIMTTEHLKACRHLFGEVPEWVEREAEIRSVESRTFASREVIGTAQMPDARVVRVGFVGPTHSGENAGATRLVDITAPATDAAKQWEGWGTALKPAHEPIVVARKPLVGTVAANVLEHGTGALNIDGCRVATADRFDGGAKATSGFADGYQGGDGWTAGSDLGRWPANLVLTHAVDCADTCAPSCAVAALDAQSADLGGASRFFTVADYDPIADAVPFAYIAKAGRAEREAGGTNAHPTVKPVELMRWLVRLVTPPDGTVLDPFAGSGSTLVAARLEGFSAVGIEMTADYLPIIEGRIAWAARQAVQLSLFGEEGTAA